MNKQLEGELFRIIKVLKGSLLTVGIDDIVILKQIDKNKKINRSFNLEKGYKKFTREQKKEGYTNLKIKKLKKKLKDKVDYILCDVNGINYYLRQFINSSFTIVNKQIIFYGVYDEYDVDRIIDKYQRYNVKVKKNIYDKSFLLIIDTDKIKTTKLKIIKNKIIDFFKDILEAIGNGLMQ